MGMNKFCPVCKISKAIDLFRKRSKSKTGYDYICKECHSKKQKNRWRLKSFEEKKSLNKKYYTSHRSKLKNLSLGKLINRWAQLILNRKYTCGNRTSSVSKNRFVSRQSISKKILISKAIKGLKLFPYMSFLNFRGDGNEMCYASLDRIDSNLPYSNNNIQIIPYWLNSAKLNGSIGKLHELIRDYYLRFIK